MIVALLLGLTACGGSGSGTGGGGGSAAGTPSAANTVEIKNFAFEPQKLTVKAGTTVTWTNQDSAEHTATASDKSFDSGNLAKGKTFQHTFDKPGTYDYICDIHQFMTGTVTVQ